MSEDSEQAAKYRAVAEQLRRLAAKIEYDYSRSAQLRALADGFERFAARFEQKTE